MEFCAPVIEEIVVPENLPVHMYSVLAKNLTAGFQTEG